MRKFTIAPIACPELEQAAREKIDNLTKPKGSLGRLEELALQVCMIQQTLSPSLNNPYNLLLQPTTALWKRRSVLRRRRLLGSKSVISCTEEPVSTFCAANMDSVWKSLMQEWITTCPTKRHH